MNSRMTLGIRIYEFYRSKGYTKAHEEFGMTALKPPAGFEIGYIPITVYMSHPYDERCVRLLLEREGYTEAEFYSWLKKHG